MLHTFAKFSFILLFLLIGFSSQAQVSYTWTGSVSTDWNTAGNWNPVGLPEITDAVIISGTGVTDWPVLTGDVTLYQLNLNSGSSIDTKGYRITTQEKAIISGATINNTNSEKSILFTFTGDGASIGNSTFNGNTEFFHDAVATTYDNNGNSNWNALEEGQDGSNHFIGNTKIMSNGARGFISLCNKFKSVFEGNVEITFGQGSHQDSDLFRQVGTLTGDLKLVNNSRGGHLNIGNRAIATTIEGKVDIISSSYARSIILTNVTNSTTGGEIDASYCGLFLRNCNLKVKSIKKLNGLEVSFIENIIEGNLHLVAPEGVWFMWNKIIGDIEFVLGDPNMSEKEHNEFGSNYQGNVKYTFNRPGDEFRVEGSTFTQNIIFSGGKDLNFGSFRYSNYLDNVKKVILTGTGNTIIDGYVAKLSIEKDPGGKVTANSLKIKELLTFVSGVVDGEIFFNDNANYSGSSNISHITGSVHKIGNDAFTFPIGSGTKLMPVTITAPSGITDEFSAEYIATPPTSNGYNTNSKAGSLTNVYNSGFWDIQRVAGSSNVTVSLGYNLPPGNISDQTKLRVAHWNNGIWEDLGNGGTSGSLTVGTVSTASGVTSFSPFTIASADASNPLPVKLVKFSAQKEGEIALLRWSTTEEENSDRFEIEHSADAKNWDKLGEVKASGESRLLASYRFTHAAPFPGLNYYRLKMVDLDGTFAYSRIENLKLSSLAQTVMYPNPVADRLFLETANGVAASKVKITNNLGRIILVTNGKESGKGIDMSKLSPGLYFVEISLVNGQKETHKVFVNR